MLMTREADYAVRCVLEVARHGHTSVTAVAADTGISASFLSKIVRRLARAGILTTRRGVGGGMTLARPTEQITMLQVIEAAGGPLHLGECLMDPPRCLKGPTCPIHPYLRRAEESLRRGLSVSLAELLAGAGGHEEASPGADPDPQGDGDAGLLVVGLRPGPPGPLGRPSGCP